MHDSNKMILFLDVLELSKHKPSQHNERHSNRLQWKREPDKQPISVNHLPISISNRYTARNPDPTTLRRVFIQRGAVPLAHIPLVVLLIERKQSKRRVLGRCLALEHVQHPLISILNEQQRLEHESFSVTLI